MLSMRFIGPYEIIEKTGPLAYRFGTKPRAFSVSWRISGEHVKKTSFKSDTRAKRSRSRNLRKFKLYWRTGQDYQLQDKEVEE